MSSESDLRAFVDRAIAAGASREEIVSSLGTAGWSDPQIRDALDRFAGSTIAGVPVPRPAPSSTARDVFVYGAMFTSLYVAAINVGGILFGVIDVVFGEAEATMAQAIRWPLSVAIVAVPAFLFLNRLVQQEAREDPNRRMSDIRRALTYLTLFVSGLTVLGVVSNLIYSALGGELATGFLLKSLVVAGIAGTGFAHYLRDMRVASAAPTGTEP